MSVELKISKFILLTQRHKKIITSYYILVYKAVK